MLLNNVIQELYLNNLKLITDSCILNIVTDTKSYQSDPKYLNILINDELISYGHDVVWDLTLGVPFPDNSLTAIVCNDFFDQLNYDEQTYFLTEAFRCLKDKGTIELQYNPVVIQYNNDIDFNRAINTIPAHAFINSYTGLKNRIISLGIESQYIHQKNKQQTSLEHTKHHYIEITKPTGLVTNDVPNIQKLVPDLFEHDAPKISVLYLTYNQAEYITETIESILQQSYTNFEIIWGDDGSTDMTMLYMIKYKNKYPHMVKTPFYGVKNVGRVNNLHRSIDIATGEYLAICEGDDVWLTRTRLKRQLHFMIDHCFDCSMTQVLISYSNGQNVIRAIAKKLISYEYVLHQTHLCTLSAMIIKKSVFYDTPNGFWDLDIADYIVGLYVTLKNKLGLGFLNSDPILYRIHSNALWSSLSDHQKNKNLLQLQKQFISLFNMKDIYDKDNAIVDSVDAELIIFDDQYPVKQPYGWRSHEFEHYTDNIQTVIMSFNDDQGSFNENMSSYVQYHPNTKIILYNPHRKINVKLAYTLFLNNIFHVLPVITSNKIPFIFTLYPGGGFRLNNKESDQKLEMVFSSPFFKEVIVTQEVTRKYLLEHNFCKQEQIKYIYGGVQGLQSTQKTEDKYFNGNRSEFNICFCAFKYTKKGVDKGYDLFIQVGQILTEKYENIHLHVIGNFDKHDVPCNTIKHLHFHGSLFATEYDNVINKMDLVVSLPRFGLLQTGAFNGFPLNTDFACVGVPIITTDELNCNTHYTNDEDIVIVDFNSHNIAQKIEYYYNNPDQLKLLSEKSFKRTQELFSDEVQLGQRMQILTPYLTT